MARCLEQEGDPRGWPEFEPADCDSWDMQAKYSYCTWTLESDGVGMVARTRWGPSAEIPLPFRPRWVPQYGVVRCGEEEGASGTRPNQRVRTLSEFSAGFLVGYNSGEWGGGLYWYARDGELRQRVLDDNVIRVVPFGARFLAFTGIAHLVTDEGQATLLEFDGHEWSIVHSVDLTGMPLAFVDEPNGALLIATSDRIVRLSDAKRVEVLYRSKFGFDYPTSIIRDEDGTLYLGERYVVVRLRPRDVGYTETWLAPHGATRPRPPGE
jgi:hypothetical protein